MKITLINHSDTLGGASVVTFRLMEALRRLGHDARMLVMHKGSDSAFVEIAAKGVRAKIPFLAEHARIYAANGFNRDDLFKVSLGSDGLALSRHPLVREADAVLINWVNQGMLSLKEIGRIAARTRVVWTMHDMWNLTGICHHAGTCRNFAETPGCGDCLFVHRRASARDVSRRVWERKRELYSSVRLQFVAVSSWLAGRCRRSSLMRDLPVEVIPNAFPVGDYYAEPRLSRAALRLPDGKKIILMGAARLDDPVKGIDYAVEALNKMERRDDVAVVFFGNMRNPAILEGLKGEYVWTGPVADPRELYAQASVVMSSSLYETLPGTLIEGQAAGCMPVAFDSGGQRDIITSESVGRLVEPYDTDAFAAALDAAVAAEINPDALRRHVADLFSADAVARRYVELIGAR